MGIEIKIGRHNYTITKEDRFMDNGSVVMLLTQSQEKVIWGHRCNPRLSKKLAKKLYKDYEKVHLEYTGDFGFDI